MLQRTSLPLNPSIEGLHVESCMKELATLLGNQPGFEGGYWGRQLEEPNVVELFIFWTSFSSFKDFTASNTNSHFLVAISSLCISQSTYLAAISPSHPAVVLTAPVVEVLTFSHLTSSRHLDPVRLPNFRRLLRDCGGWVGDAVGPGLDPVTGKEVLGEEEVEDGVGRGKSWLILGGWRSVEVHKGFQASAAFKERPGVDGRVEACHVVFRKLED